MNTNIIVNYNNSGFNKKIFRDGENIITNRCCHQISCRNIAIFEITSLQKNIFHSCKKHLASLIEWEGRRY